MPCGFPPLGRPRSGGRSNMCLGHTVRELLRPWQPNSAPIRICLMMDCDFIACSCRALKYNELASCTRLTLRGQIGQRDPVPAGAAKSRPQGPSSILSKSRRAGSRPLPQAWAAEGRRAQWRMSQRFTAEFRRSRALSVNPDSHRHDTSVASRLGIGRWHCRSLDRCRVISTVTETMPVVG